jgi:hypothetical protein
VDAVRKSSELALALPPCLAGSRFAAGGSFRLPVKIVIIK